LRSRPAENIPQSDDVKTTTRADRSALDAGPRIGQAIHRIDGQGILALRPVDGDGRDTIVDGITDRFAFRLFHGGSSKF
jgi:hypothetical protein